MPEDRQCITDLWNDAAVTTVTESGCAALANIGLLDSVRKHN